MLHDFLLTSLYNVFIFYFFSNKNFKYVIMLMHIKFLSIYSLQDIDLHETLSFAVLIEFSFVVLFILSTYLMCTSRKSC